MAKTKVVFYKEKDEKIAPVLEWLDTIPLKSRLKCLTRIERLREEGHRLRRPEADYEGHSLAMLNRIAAALYKRVEIRFLPLKRDSFSKHAHAS